MDNDRNIVVAGVGKVAHPSNSKAPRQRPLTETTHRYRSRLWGNLPVERIIMESTHPMSTSKVTPAPDPTFNGFWTEDFRCKICGEHAEGYYMIQPELRERHRQVGRRASLEEPGCSGK